MQKSDLFAGTRLRLGPMEPGAAEYMARWSQDSSYLRDLDTDIAVPRTASLMQERMEATGGSAAATFEFLIRVLPGDEPIGFVALHSIEWNNRCGLVAIGIGEPGYRRRGYGREALERILRFAFCELNLNRAGLDVIAYNRAVLGLYESIGFRREGAMRAAVLRDGQAFDRVIMGILREEWENELEADDDDEAVQAH